MPTCLCESTSYPFKCCIKDCDTTWCSEICRKRCKSCHFTKKHPTDSFDISTFPLRMIHMGEDDINQISIIRSPFHEKKIIFCRPYQSPCCSNCRNSMVVQDVEGYIMPVVYAYCDKCNLSFQVAKVVKE